MRETNIRELGIISHCDALLAETNPSGNAAFGRWSQVEFQIHIREELQCSYIAWIVHGWVAGGIENVSAELRNERHEIVGPVAVSPAPDVGLIAVARMVLEKPGIV